MIIPVPQPGDLRVPSFYAFSFWKSGSTLLDSMLREICSLRGIAVYNPSAELFRSGTPDESAVMDSEALYASHGYCFGVFRSIPPFVAFPRLAGRKTLLLVRDPRDILTSLYYSTAISHPAPGDGELRKRFDTRRTQVQAMSLDEFVLQDVPAIEATLDALVLGLRHTNMRLYRYEDVIFRKREWIEDISDFLDLDIPRDALAAIAARHDVQPNEDRPEEHVRQVRPGDHSRKLRPETVTGLNAQLSDRWRSLDYPFAETHADISFPAAAFQALPTSVMVEVRDVSDERSREVESALLSRIEGAEIYPSQGAEILGLWVEDETGRRSAALPAEAPFTVAYLVRVAVDERVVFGFRITDGQGDTKIGWNTEVLQVQVPPIRPPRLAEVRWRLPGLPPGDYRVTCGCSRPPDMVHFFARHVDAYRMSVAAET